MFKISVKLAYVHLKKRLIFYKNLHFEHNMQLQVLSCNNWAENTIHTLRSEIQLCCVMESHRIFESKQVLKEYIWVKNKGKKCL